MSLIRRGREEGYLAVFACLGALGWILHMDANATQSSRSFSQSRIPSPSRDATSSAKLAASPQTRYMDLGLRGILQAVWSVIGSGDDMERVKGSWFSRTIRIGKA